MLQLNPHFIPDYPSLKDIDKKYKVWRSECGLKKNSERVYYSSLHVYYKRQLEGTVHKSNKLLIAPKNTTKLNLVKNDILKLIKLIKNINQ